MCKDDFEWKNMWHISHLASSMLDSYVTENEYWVKSECMSGNDFSMLYVCWK